MAAFLLQFAKLSHCDRDYSDHKAKHLTFDPVERKSVDPYLRIIRTNGLTNLCPAKEFIYPGK